MFVMPGDRAGRKRASAGGITQLTSDVTAGPGSGSQAATLAASGVTPGTYTNATVTFDAKGRATAASNGGSGLPGGGVNLSVLAFNSGGAAWQQGIDCGRWS